MGTNRRMIVITAAAACLFSLGWSSDANAQNGACCLPGSAGTCQQTTVTNCFNLNGNFLGEGIPCTPNPCLGACCELATGVCLIRTPLDCDALPGVYVGDATTCPPTPPCEQPIPVCPEDGSTLYGQQPALPTELNTAAPSDQRVGVVRYEQFQNLQTYICEVGWWGVNRTNANATCVKTPDTYIINFYENAGGSPGTLAFGPFNVTPTKQQLGLTYAGSPLYRYRATLPNCNQVALIEGWISIQGVDAGQNCNFLWMSATQFAGDSKSFRDSGAGLVMENFDLSLCLINQNLPWPEVGGACCNDSEGPTCLDENDFPGGWPMTACFPANGERFKANATCAQLTPPCGTIEGACCLPDSSCFVDTQAVCLAQGGIYAGNSSVCTASLCIGACCDPNTGICSTVGQETCLAAGGEYRGNGTSCPPTPPCPIPPLVNDLCTDAAGPIPVPSTIVGTTIGASADVPPAFTCVTTVTGPGVWYKVMGTGTTITATTCDGSATSGFDTKLFVYCGDCSGLTCVTGNDDTPVGVNPNCTCPGCGGNWESTVTWCSQVGAEYLIMVGGFGAATTGNFTLTLTHDGIPCTATVFCLPPIGACCNLTTCASDVTRIDCEAGGGTYVGDGSSCDPNPCLSGACCNPESGACTETPSQATCEATGGIWQGNGSNCFTVVCPQPPTGACCVGPTCSIISQFDCNAQSGNYVGDNSGCGGDFIANPAIPIPDANVAGITHVISVGDSFVVTDLDVDVNITHTWIGDLNIEVTHNATTVVLWDNGCGNFDNMDVIFDDTGAAVACATPTVGTILPVGNLAAFEGMNSTGDWTIHVYDTVGADVGVLQTWSLHLGGALGPCAGPGACCVADVCTPNLTPAECIPLGGIYQGPDAPCTPNPCIVGACCNIGTGVCTPGVSQVDCEAQPGGGVYHGGGSVCTPFLCPQPETGACCHASDCTITSEFDCTNTGGDYAGDNSSCSAAFTSSPGLPIVDNAAQVAVDVITVVTPGTVADVDVDLNITHSWLGDLIVDITHNGTTVRVVNQPGLPLVGVEGCDLDNYNNILLDDDGTGGPIHDQCVTGLTSPPSYTPENPLSAFNGMSIQGDWTIRAADAVAAFDPGVLVSWSLHFGGASLGPCAGPGACCIGSACTPNLTPAQCNSVGGIYQGADVPCSPNPCLLGACCNIGTGVCTPTISQEECEAQPGVGVFQGGGSFCTGELCPQPEPGACCLGPNCFITTQFDCENQSGSFVGPNTGCGGEYIATPGTAIPDANAAGITHVMTVPDSFIITDADVDLIIPHTFIGDLAASVTHSGVTVQIWNHTCGGNNNMDVVFDDEGTAVVCASPTVGNILPNQALSAFDGFDASGDWTIFVADTVGADVGTLVQWSLHLGGSLGPCAGPGACCVGTTCTPDLEPPACQALGGIYQGPDTLCSPNPCLLGACCNTGTGECINGLTQAACEALPGVGVFQGGGTFCTPILCPQPEEGACCVGPVCSITTAFDCENQGGSYAGDNTNCGGEIIATPGIAIPDANAAGITHIINVTESFTITDVDVDVIIPHTWIGDLEMAVTHDATTVMLWDNACGNFDNMNVVYDDEGNAVACATPTVGNILPNQALSAFDGMNAIGDWTIRVSDTVGADIGTLQQWSLHLGGSLGPCAGPGACCVGASCTELQTPAECQALGGIYQGPDVPCTPNPCLLGACCITGTGECLSGLTEAECTAQAGGGVFQGNGSFCTPILCPQPPRGACCVPAGCQTLSAFECQQAGGSYAGDGTECNAVFDIPANVAILDVATVEHVFNIPDSGTIEDLNLDLNITHTFIADLDIFLIHNATILDVFSDNCGANDNMNVILDDEGAVLACGAPTVGTFRPDNPLSAFDGQDMQGDWTIRITDDLGGDFGILINWSLHITGSGVGPCANAPGACCVSGVCSSVQNPAECAGLGGQFMGANSTCSPNPCTAGACCTGATCQVVADQAECTALTGTFQGLLTDCSPNPCGGACCDLLTAQCTIDTQSHCESIGSNFIGLGTTCDTPCPPPPTGACCVASACSIVTQFDCQTATGTYQGNNTSCGGDFVSNPSLVIPDNLPAGVSNIITVGDAFQLTDVNVDLTANHTWVGDMAVSLTHNGTTVVVLDRPGVPLSTFGCGLDNFNNIILDDQGTGGAIEALCVNNITSPPNYTPNNPLSAFTGMNAQGDWTISISDNAAGDTGTLVQWSLHFQGIGLGACAGTGACCVGIDCTITSTSACLTSGGTFAGPNTTCSPSPCEIGACCNVGTGLCVEGLTPAQCAAVLGVGSYQGAGSACITTNCPQPPMGACCAGLDCSAATSFGCTSGGGQWLGVAENCPSATTDTYEAQVCNSAWEDISVSGNPVLRAPGLGILNNQGIRVNLGFSFNYFGASYTDVAVCSNGYLTFDNPGTTTTTAETPLPTLSVPNNLIAMLWDDLDPNITPVPNGTTVPFRVHTQTLGTGTSRRFIVQFTGVRESGTGSPATGNTFQAVLYEETGCVELRYQRLTIASAADYRIGIENPGGTIGLDVSSMVVSPLGPLDPPQCISICPVPPENPCANIPTECSCPGDMNDSGGVNGADIQAWVSCYLSGSTTGPCNCTDMNANDILNQSDVGLFVQTLLSPNPCSGAASCATCAGDGSGDNYVSGVDAAYFVNCYINGPGVTTGCACCDMNAVPDGQIDQTDAGMFVDRLLNAGACE